MSKIRSTDRKVKRNFGPTSSLSSFAPGQIGQELGSGQQLGAHTRARLEPYLGQSLEGIRIHTGPQAEEQARAVEARAFTVGRDITFGADQYKPGTPEGLALLAHEVTHVAQQSATGTLAIQRAPLQPGSEKRQDVVIIVGRPSRTVPANETLEQKQQMESWRAAARSFSPVVLEGLTVDQAFAGLKQVKTPIGKLYIIGHADESGVGEVSPQGDNVSSSVESLTRRMGAAAGPLGDRRPDSVEMLSCFGGGSPKTMGRIGETLGASKVRAPLQMTVITGQTFKLDGKVLTAGDMQRKSDEILQGYIQKTDALKNYDFVPGVPHPAEAPTKDEKLKALIGLLRRTGTIPFVGFNAPAGQRDAVPYWKAQVEKKGKNDEVDFAESLLSKDLIEVNVNEPAKKP